MQCVSVHASHCLKNELTLLSPSLCVQVFPGGTSAGLWDLGTEHSGLSWALDFHLGPVLSPLPSSS